MRHIFLTARREPPPRWREAFPLAEVLPHPRPGTQLVARPGEAMIWLHLPRGGKGAAGLIHAAALAAPACHVVVLANVPGQQEGLVCLEAGAAGYVNAIATPEVLRQVATVVENGGLWVGPELMGRLRTALAGRQREARAAGVLADLSPREREVALAVAGGASNKEVARALGITERTVKAHLTAIFERLGVRDRLHLTILVNGGEAPPPGPRFVH